MSDYSSSLVDCEKIQGQLSDTFAKINPARIVGNIGTAQALMDPINTDAVLEKTISPGNGKKRTVKLLYDQRLLLSQLSDSAVQVCTSSNKDGELYEEYTIDTTAGTSIDREFELTDLTERCEDDDTYFNRKLVDYLMACDRKINKDSLTQLAAKYGAFANGDTNLTGAAGAAQIKTVYTRKTGGVDRDTNALEMLKSSPRRMSYPTAPIIIGGTGDEMETYLEVMAKGCCADNGLDFGAIMADTSLVYVSDENMSSVMGNTTDFLTFGAGAAQLLTYNEFMGPKGIRVQDTEIYKQTVIYSPLTGIPYDFTYKVDCGKVYIQIKLAHVVVAMPDDMFQQGDILRGVEWINRWRTATR